jgi:hypothetical protein
MNNYNPTQLSIDQAAENANDDFIKAAKQAVMICVDRGREFTTDDIWQLLDGWGITTHENRALGSVMQSASRKGLITNTYRTQKTVRPSNHSRPITIWEPTK